MTKTDYYIEQSDIAHALYKNRGGSYKAVWMGAAKGFKTRIANETLFSDCIEKATLMISK